MPIVDIELVADPDDAVADGLAQSLADAVGRALRSPPGQSWVRLHVLARGHYAENDSPVEANSLPVFVRVLQRAPPAGEQLAREISALTGILGAVLGRATSCVHIEYAPGAAGRVSFGGNLVV